MSLKTSNIETHSDKDKRGSDFIVTELCAAGRWRASAHLPPPLAALLPARTFRALQAPAEVSFFILCNATFAYYGEKL